jgi:hypothetical protein
MRATPLKYSFNAGELTPLLDGRTDQAKYFNGASVLENFIPTVQGPIIRRGGTMYANEVKASANRTWLRRFNFNVTQSYMLEFGDQYIRFYTNRGVVLEAALVITAATQANPCVITSNAHGFSNGQWVYLANIVGMTELNGKLYKVAGVAANTFQLQDTDGNAIDSTTFTAYVSGGTVARVYEIASPYTAADLTDSDGNFRLSFRQSGSAIYITHNANTYQQRKLSRLGALNWTLAAVDLGNGPFKDTNTDKASTVYASFLTTNVTGTANNGAGLVRLAVASTTGFTTGQLVDVANVGGTVEANGQFTVTVIDATHMDLQGTTYANAYTTGGTATMSNAVNQPVTLTASGSIFQAGHVNSLFYAAQQPSDTLKSWEAGKNIASKEIRRNGFNYYQAEKITGSAIVTGVSLAANCVITAVAHGFITGDYVFIDNVGGTVEVNGQWYYVKKINNNTFYIMDPDNTTTYINSTGYTAYASAGTANKGKLTGGVGPVHTEGARTDGDPGVNWTYLHSGFGVVKITGFTSGTVVTGTVNSKIPDGCVGSGNPTYIWAHSLYSTVEGWPELVGLFRERLSFLKGLSLAMSVSADYENFAGKIGGQVTADAGIRITLPDTNPARWLMDGNDLLVGTAGREIAVGKVTTTEPLGPSNIEAKKQTAYGSRAVEPVEVGNSVLIVTRSGTKLREIVFDWTRAAYVSSDLTVLSEHIAKAGLSQIAYQQEPYGIVWGCTVTGGLVGFTFNREQDVLAWHRHPIGLNGIVESVQSIPSPDGKRDDLWLIVKRTINGVTRRYVEYMMPEFDGDDSTIADAFYVDAGLTYSGASTVTIPGLDHLKGATVDILGNGAPQAQKVVSSLGGGRWGVTLDYAVTKAQIGLPCPCRVKTVRLEAGSQLGTAQGKVKRITRLFLRLLKSLGGKFGSDTSGTMDDLQYRDAGALMDTPPALKTGDFKLPFPAGYDTDGYVTVYNDQPLPMTIISFTPDVVTNEG